MKKVLNYINGENKQIILNINDFSNLINIIHINNNEETQNYFIKVDEKEKEKFYNCNNIIDFIILRAKKNYIKY